MIWMYVALVLGVALIVAGIGSTLYEDYQSKKEATRQRQLYLTASGEDPVNVLKRVREQTGKTHRGYWKEGEYIVEPLDDDNVF